MLIIRLGPSRLLGVLLAAMHATCLIVLIFCIDLHAGGKALGSLMLILSLQYYVRRHAWRLLPESIVMLCLSSDNRLRLQARSGHWMDAVVLPGSFVTPVLTTLRYRRRGRRASSYVAICCDAADADAARRLRVHLKWRH